VLSSEKKYDLMTKFNENDIRQWAGHTIFFRGREYFLDEMVLDSSWANGILRGQVEGSLKFPYKVTINFNSDIPRPSCTCPFEGGDWCKHAVALALDWSHKNSFAIEEKPQITKSSMPSILQINDNDSVFQKPIIRMMFPDQKFFGLSSKGLKIKILISDKGNFQAFNNWYYLKEQDEYSYRNYSHYPSILSQLNAGQINVLKTLCSISKDRYNYNNELFIDEHLLTILFTQMESVEGIEIFAGKKLPLTLRRDKIVPARLELSINTTGGILAEFHLLDPDNPSQKIDGHIVFGRPCWFFDFQNGRIFALDKIITQEFFKDWFSLKSATQIPPIKIPALLNDLVPRMKSFCEIIYHDDRLKTIESQDATAHFQVYLDYIDNKVLARLFITYLDKIFKAETLPIGQEYILQDAKNPFSWIKRNLMAEKEMVVLLLKDCRFRYENETLHLSNPDDIASLLWEKLPSLQAKAEIFYTENFKNIQSQSPLIPEMIFGESSLDWFYFDVKYRSKNQGQEFSHDQILQQLLRGKNYIHLKNGQMIPIDRGGFEKAQSLLADLPKHTDKLPVFHAPFLIEEAKQLDVKASFNDSFQALHQKLKEFDSIKTVKLPSKLKDILRDYQRKGVDWLNFLKEFNFGGILADEMGLGKTLQVLALIQKRKENNCGLPSLVVCPTTLVWNWQAEIKKFLPSLTVLIPTGKDRRQQLEKIKEHDIVITSYALLRRDSAYYTPLEFDYVILDEAQNIKNHQTINAKAVKQLKSHYRLVLTGTPMENSISDLWSILDFLMPGYLGGHESFRGRYEIPILKNKDTERLKTLSRKIKPFILRRLKTDVIRELPEKIEQIGWCELEPTQQRCYEQMLSLAKTNVLKAYQEKGLNKSRMAILTIILRLRQICCHPLLAGVNLGHRLQISSKLNLLKELLSESLDGGHKILIFSQFTQMLDIITEYLKKEKLTFERMDGSTKDRREIVERFNQDPETKIFLLSLKVGGVGLNLTSADTIILFEPWWNPAVEDQAIDRAHRIGQKKSVTAYKLICKGTIEEKILELQKKKKNLIDSLVVAEEGISKALDWEDIKFLLDMN